MSTEEVEQAVKTSVDNGRKFVELLKNVRAQHKFDQQQGNKEADVSLEMAGYQLATTEALSGVCKVINLLSSRNRIMKKGHARMRRGPEKPHTINIGGIIFKDNINVLLSFQANNLIAAINNTSSTVASTTASVETKHGTTCSNMSTLLRYHDKLLQRQQQAITNGNGRSTAATRMVLHHHRHPRQLQRLMNRSAVAANPNTTGLRTTSGSFLSSLSCDHGSVVINNHATKNQQLPLGDHYCRCCLSSSHDSCDHETRSCGLNGRCHCVERRYYDA